jgi:ABC-type Fe3+-siderophore transport system permease subunit
VVWNGGWTIAMELGLKFAVLLGLFTAILMRKSILLHGRESAITLGRRVKRAFFCLTGAAVYFFIVLALSRNNPEIHPLIIVPLLLLVAAWCYQSVAAIWMLMAKYHHNM